MINEAIFIIYAIAFKNCFDENKLYLPSSSKLQVFTGRGPEQRDWTKLVYPASAAGLNGCYFCGYLA